MTRPLVDLAARRNFLNNAELIRRLHAVGEHQKALMLTRSTRGQAERLQRQVRAAEQQGGYDAAHREEARENEADLAADVAEGMLGGDGGPAPAHRAVARIGHIRAPNPRARSRTASCSTATACRSSPTSRRRSGQRRTR